MRYAVPFIDKALRGRVLYEDYQGDLAGARDIAERAGDGLDAQLARALVLVLQGEPGAALTALPAPHLLEGDPARQLLAVVYEKAAWYLRCFTFPDGRSASGLELDRRWDGLELARRLGPRREALSRQREDLDPQVELHARAINDLGAEIPQARRLAASVRYRSGESARAGLEVATSGVRRFAAIAESRGAEPAWRARADLLHAELLRRSGSAAVLGRAAGHLDSALGICERAGDGGGAGLCHLARGDFAAARCSTPAVWNLAIEETTLDGDPSGHPLEHELGRRPPGPEAEAAYAEALQCFSGVGATRGVAAVRLRQGHLAAAQGDYPGAAARAEEALSLFRTAGDGLGEQLARAHRLLGRIGAGLLLEDRAEAAAIGRWGRDRGSFSFALGLGLMMARAGRLWLTQQGDYERALSCLRLAEALHGAQGATANEAQSLEGQASIYELVGEGAAARDLRARALDRYQAPQQTPSGDGTVGMRIEQRVTHLRRALFWSCHEQRDPDGMERALGALKAAQPEDPFAALRAFLDAPGAAGQDLLAPLTGAAMSGLSHQASSALRRQAEVLVPLHRALLCREAGDDQAADGHFQRALRVAQATPGGEATLLEAKVLKEWRRYPEAAAAARRYFAAGGNHAGFVGGLSRLAGPLLGGEGEAMQRRHAQANLGHAVMMFTECRDYPEAKRWLDEIERDAGPTWWAGSERPWEDLRDAGDIHAGLGAPLLALPYYRTAIRELEERRGRLGRDDLKVALASGRGAQHLYFRAARTALRQGLHADAFELAERGKARALLDLLSGGARAGPGQGEARARWHGAGARVQGLRGLLARELGQERPDPARVESLRATLGRTQAELSEAEAALRDAEPRFYQTVNPAASVLSLKQACAALPDGTALLQYFFLGEELLCWALTREGMVAPRVIPLDAAELDRKLRAYRQQCADGSPGAGPDPMLGRDLAGTFLAPMRAVLERCRRLLLVPYGEAHALPLHVLPWAEAEPLSASHVVSYLPSASTLPLLSEPGPLAGAQVLSVGVSEGASYQPPVGAPLRYRALPMAALEAELVARLLPGALLLRDGEAQKALVQAQLPLASIVHFATHGHLSEEAPLWSSVLLAGGEPLRVAELLGLKLRADLVVLSACETGRGAVTGGDEVLGLGRGLLGAGARGAVVSLWNAADETTFLLMAFFYTGLAGGLAPALALQGAQSRLRGLGPRQGQEQMEHFRALAGAPAPRARGLKPMAIDYRRPFFWAPFIHLGGLG